MKNRIIFLFLIKIILINCTSFRSIYKSESYYKIFKNSKKPEVIFRINDNSNGKFQGELSSDLLYKSSIIGEVKFLKNGDFEFYINTIKYFSEWSNGWTEGINNAYGKILFKNSPEGFVCEIIEQFELLDVLEGKIRYYDNYFIKQNGKQKVKERIIRIFSVVDFLKKSGYPEYFTHIRFNSNYGPGFIKMTKPFLFPESLINKSKTYLDIVKTKKDNENIIEKNEESIKDESIKNRLKWSIGEGKIWNTEYTKTIFPETLHDLRDSGTMWRDYEEAPGIFMIFYNLDYFFNKHLSNITFKKVK